MKFLVLILLFLTTQFSFAANETFNVDVVSKTNNSYTLQLGVYAKTNDMALVRENFRKQVEEIAKTMGTYSFLKNRGQIMERIERVLNTIPNTKIQGLSIIRLKKMGNGQYDIE